MGTDKALLPHPEGGCWLERTLRLLLELEIPVTLYSRHESHLELARALNGESLPPGLQAGNEPEATSLPITALAEPEPWEGPLLALHRLMQRYPDQRLLLCPVDMPWLRLEEQRQLLAAAEREPGRIHLAHDGERRQPLLGLYPSTTEIRTCLAEAAQGGERRLQGWLAAQNCRDVLLKPATLRNINHPEDLTTSWGRG